MKKTAQRVLGLRPGKEVYYLKFARFERNISFVRFSHNIFAQTDRPGQVRNPTLNSTIYYDWWLRQTLAKEEEPFLFA